MDWVYWSECRKIGLGRQVFPVEMCPFLRDIRSFSGGVLSLCGDFMLFVVVQLGVDW